MSILILTVTSPIASIPSVTELTLYSVSSLGIFIISSIALKQASTGQVQIVSCSTRLSVESIMRTVAVGNPNVPETTCTSCNL